MTYEEIVSFVRENLKKTGVKNVENETAVQFDIKGEGEGAFYIAVKGNKLLVEPFEYYDRDAKVSVTADELVKIINGEKSPIVSFEEGNLIVEGNINALQEIAKLIKTKKKSTANKTTTAEKKIVADTKKKGSKIAKDIKK